MVKFKGAGCSGGFFLRCLLKDRARSFLSCRYHYHDTDGFFHLCWYWLFSICNRYQKAQQHRGCVPCNQHGTVSMTPWRGIHTLNRIRICHTPWAICYLSLANNSGPILMDFFVIAANLVSPNFTNTPNAPQEVETDLTMCIATSSMGKEHHLSTIWDSLTTSPCFWLQHAGPLSTRSKSVQERYKCGQRMLVRNYRTVSGALTVFKDNDIDIYCYSVLFYIKCCWTMSPLQNSQQARDERAWTAPLWKVTSTTK